MCAHSADDLQSLGKALLADPTSNLNNVVPLLKALHTKQPQVIQMRLNALDFVDELLCKQ